MGKRKRESDGSEAESSSQGEVQPAVTPRDVIAAALAGHTQRLAFVLSAAGDERLAAATPWAGCAPLLAAILGGSPACVSMLCKLVDVNKAFDSDPDEQLLRAHFHHLWPSSPLVIRERQLPLYTAVRQGQYGVAHALLDAGADARALEAHASTSVLRALADQINERVWHHSSLCCSGDPRDADHFAASAAPPLLNRLLQAGADLLAPQHWPALYNMVNPPLSAACLTWLLEAHRSGRRALGADGVAVALHAALKGEHGDLLPELLALAQQQRADLSPAALLQVLAAAAQHGNLGALQSILLLGVEPADPGTARHCLLAHAAGQADTAKREQVLAALLHAGARVHVEDICCAVTAADVGALRRLLQLGAPKPDAAAPWVSPAPCPERLFSSKATIACPLLLNMAHAGASLKKYQQRAGDCFPRSDYLRQSLLEDMSRRLDVAAALGAAGYAAAVWRLPLCGGQLGRPPALPPGVPAWQAKLLLLHKGDDGQHQWSLDLLARASPGRFMAAGGNRLLVLAAEQPELGPGTLRRFPARLRAAVRSVLLIAQHGKAMRPQQELSIEQLAVLCAWQRRQAFVLLDREAAAACPDSASAAAAVAPAMHSDYKLQVWASEHGWAPPAQRATRSPSHLGPDELRLRTLAALAADGSANMDSALAWLLEEIEEDRMMARQLAHSPTGLPDGTAALQRLRASEAQLDARLLAGGMELPAALLVPHALCRLPHELVLRIVQLAAYPLSSWVAEEDFQMTPEEAADAAAGPH